MTATTTPTKHQCPECPANYDDARGLATHRRYKHGIAGKSKTAMQYQEQKNAGSTRVHTRLKGSFPCTHEGCTFVAQWKGGLTHHMRTHSKNKRSLQLAKQNRTEIASNGAGANHSNSQEANFAPDGIPEATLAVALGRFQELCRSMAFEFDLPPRMFTQRVAALIYRSQIR